jgi:hypothetical protein
VLPPDLVSLLSRNYILVGIEPLLQLDRKSRLHEGWIDAVLEPPHDVEPFCLPIRAPVSYRNPQLRWIAAQCVAEESRRSDAHNRERELIQVKRGADDRRVRSKVLLPRGVTHHRHRRG